MTRKVAILVALLSLPAASALADGLGVFQAGKAGGNIYEGTQPRKGPKECFVTVSPAGQSREITISTDQPFRARRQTVFVAGSGSKKYIAISFRVPADMASAIGTKQPADDMGYVAEVMEEKKAKLVSEGGTMRVKVKFDGESPSIIRDSAEITLTPDFVPVLAKVDSLTKWSNTNKKSRMTCERFTLLEVESSRSTAIVSVSDDDSGPAEPAGLSPGREAFWQSLRGLCGQAYAHVQQQPVPSRPVLDVRECEEDSILFGVHYLAGEEQPEWNRSQTWRVSRNGPVLQMKYARRASAAPGASESGWNAWTKNEGNAEIQVFLPDEGTVEESPNLENFGWVLRIQADATGAPTLLYQAVEKTEEGEVSRGGYLFDLSAAIEQPAEPPWAVTAAQASGDMPESAEAPVDSGPMEPPDAPEAADGGGEDGTAGEAEQPVEVADEDPAAE